MIVKASEYIDRAKRIELDKARREGRDVIEWDVTAEQFRINAKKLNWPAKSVHLKFNEAVAGPPHDARRIHPGTEARERSPRPFNEPEADRQ